MFGRDGCFQPTDHPVLCLSLLVFCLSIKQFASRFTDHLSASRITLCYEPALYSLQSGPGWHWDSLITFSFPDSSVGKESTYNAGDPGSIPGSGRSTGAGIGYPFQYSWASLVAQLVKNLPAMRETRFQSLDWENPLEKGMASHSRILAWRIPWMEEPGRLQSMVSQRVRHD